MVTESLRLYSEFQANQGCRMKLGEKKKKRSRTPVKSTILQEFPRRQEQARHHVAALTTYNVLGSKLDEHWKWCRICCIRICSQHEIY